LRGTLSNWLRTNGESSFDWHNFTSTYNQIGKLMPKQLKFMVSPTSFW